MTYDLKTYVNAKQRIRNWGYLNVLPIISYVENRNKIIQDAEVMFIPRNEISCYEHSIFVEKNTKILELVEYACKFNIPILSRNIRKKFGHFKRKHVV